MRSFLPEWFGTVFTSTVVLWLYVAGVRLVLIAWSKEAKEKGNQKTKEYIEEQLRWIKWPLYLTLLAMAAGALRIVTSWRTLWPLLDALTLGMFLVSLIMLVCIHIWVDVRR